MRTFAETNKQMQELYNKIKPVGKRVIILVNPDEKRQHTIDLDAGGSITLDIAIDYSWDGRITGFTQGLLLTDYKNLKAGTNVLVHHNSMGDENELVYNGIPNGTKIYSVDDQFIYFGVDGEDIICIDGYMLVERMYEPEAVSAAGIILISEPVQITNKLKVLAKPDSITDYKVGDIAIVYKYSDYEMNHTFNGKKRQLIRLKYADCLAIETI